MIQNNNIDANCSCTWKKLTCSNTQRIKTYNKMFRFNKILFEDSIKMF